MIPRRLSQRPAPLRCIFAVTLAALALACTYVAWPVLASTPFALLFGATIVSAWVAGRLAAFVALSLATLGHGVFLWIGLPGAAGAPALVVFALLAGLVSWIIAGRREIERTLRTSEAQFRAIFEAAPVGIALVDTQGRPVRANTALQRMLGYTEEELKQLTLTEFTHPEDAPVDRMLFEELIAGMRDRYRLEKRYVRKDGTVIWGDLSVSSLGAPEAGWGVAVRMVEDVTERKRSEDALLESEARLRAVVSNVPIILWALDSHGIFTLSEGLGLRQLGLLPGEVVGRSVYDVYADVPPILSAARRALQGEAFSFTSEVGSTAYENWYSPIKDPAGQVRGAIGVAIDVTERKHLERQLLQAQKMEAVGRLAGGIAHDFNNLLTAILGYTELLLEEAGTHGKDPDDLREVQKAAMSAAALTRQLLAFSRQQILQPVVLDLNAVIWNLESMLRRLIREDITVVLDLAPDPAPVHADPSQLEQVIMNLAVNARDAMPQRGTLTIATAEVDLNETSGHAGLAVPPGSYVRLRISDTGEGMTPEVQARLFEPFFTTKERGAGTGLGLSTVYGIVKQSGGFIWVESAPGQGTTFSIDLPRCPEPLEPASLIRAEAGTSTGTVAAAQATGPRAALGARQTGSETILLVEDDDRVRELGRLTLARHGYTVLTARSAEEAMALCGKHHDQIALLLTDVVMPGASGTVLAAEVASRCPRAKILYTSGYTDDAIMQHGVRNPGTSFLPKPFTPEALAKTVRQMLDQ